MNMKSVGFVLAGMAIGCGAAAVAPMVRSHAETRSSWSCYVVDRFPDVRDAAEWSGAQDIRKGMDQVAPAVAAGTIVTLPAKTGSGSNAAVLCVKYQ